MSETIIYYIENRGWFFLYHFLLFMIGGLRHIQEKKPVVYIPYMKEFLFDIDRQALEQLSGRGDKDHAGPKREGGSKFTYSTAGINYEIMNFLKDSFVFIDSLVGIPHLERIQFRVNHGEPCVLPQMGINVLPAVHVYLRDLFLSRLPAKSVVKGKYIYITRKNSDTLTGNFGIRKRQVLNETELVTMFDRYKFQYINLEDYSLAEKLDIFQTSEIIVSPNSAALTFCFVTSPKTTIIELMPAFQLGEYKQEWKQEQYKEMCEAVGTPYIRFQQMTYVEDELNMKVDIPELEKTISRLL